MVGQAALVAAMLGGCAESDMPRELTAEQVGEVGCVDCTGTESLPGVRDLALGPNGEVVVLASAEPLIRVFDLGGLPGAAFGSRGRGPGEFVAPSHVFVRADGTIQVVDMGARALRRFDTRGRLLESVAIPDIPVGAGADPESGTWFVTTTFAKSALRRVDNTGTGIELVLDSLEALVPAVPGHPLSLSPAVSPDGTVALGDGIENYRITVFNDDGDVMRQIERDLPRTRKSDDELAAEARRIQDRAGGQPMGPSGSTAGGIDEYWPYFDRERGMDFDDAGRLWVRTSRGNRQESTTFDLFDRTGEFLGEISLNRSITAFDVDADILVGSTRGEYDVPTITFWRIR